MRHNKKNIIKLLDEFRRVYNDAKTVCAEHEKGKEAKKIYDAKIDAITKCIEIIGDKREFKRAGAILPGAKVVPADSFLNKTINITRRNNNNGKL